METVQKENEICVKLSDGTELCTEASHEVPRHEVVRMPEVVPDTPKKKARFGEKLRIISVHLPPKMLEMIDRLVHAGYFSNRSEFIRAALSEFLNKWAAATQPRNGAEPATPIEEDLGILEAK